MSGDRPAVRLPADPGGVLRRLVGGLASIADAEVAPWALVGGLAVMVQVNEAHRVTTDVDAVVDETDRPVAVVELLVAEHGASRRPNGVRLADGTDLDVIAVGAWEPDRLPDDELQRMFVLAHWWALQTAAVTEVVVVDGHAVVGRAIVPVATPAGLVATKLQAVRNRRRSSHKAVTDVLDAYRLLGAHDRHGGVADALAAAPVELAAWAAAALEETFVAQASRWARRLDGVRPDDLDVVGSLCAQRLRALLG